MGQITEISNERKTKQKEEKGRENQSKKADQSHIYHNSQSSYWMNFNRLRAYVVVGNVLNIKKKQIWNIIKSIKENTKNQTAECVRSS